MKHLHVVDHSEYEMHHRNFYLHKLTVVIIEEYDFYQLHINFIRHSSDKFNSIR
jgi:hypothetical protein